MADDDVKKSAIETDDVVKEGNILCRIPIVSAFCSAVSDAVDAGRDAMKSANRQAMEDRHDVIESHVNRAQDRTPGPGGV